MSGTPKKYVIRAQARIIEGLLKRKRFVVNRKPETLQDLKDKRDELTEQVKIKNQEEEKKKLLEAHSSEADDEEKQKEEVREEIKQLESLLNEGESPETEEDPELTELKNERDALLDLLKEKYGDDVDVQKLQEEKDEAERQKVEEQKKELQEEITKLQQLLDEDNGRTVDELEEEIKADEEKLSDNEEIRELQEKRNELLEEIKEKTNEDDVSLLEKLLNELKELKEKLTESEEKATEENNETKEELKEQVEELEEINNNPDLNTVEEMNKEIEELKEKLEAPPPEDEELKELEESKDKLMSEVKEKANDDDIEKVKELLKEIEELKEKQKEKDEENQKIIDEMNEKKDELKKEIEELKAVSRNHDNIEAMESEMSQLQENLESSSLPIEDDEELIQLQEKKRQLKDELKEKYNEENNVFTATIIGTKSEMNDINNEVEMAKVINEEKKMKLENEVKRLEECMNRDNINESLNELEDELKTLEAVETVESKNDEDKDNELEELREKRKELLEKLKEKNSEDDINRLEEMIEKLEEAKEVENNKEEKIEEEEKGDEEKDKEIQELKKEISRLEGIMNNPEYQNEEAIEAKIDELEEKNESGNTDEENEEKDKEIEELREKKEELLNELKEKYGEDVVYHPSVIGEESINDKNDELKVVDKSIDNTENQQKEEEVQRLKDEIQKLEELLNDSELQTAEEVREKLEEIEKVENIENTEAGKDEELKELEQKKEELKQQIKEKYGDEVFVPSNEEDELEKERLRNEITILEDYLNNDDLDENLKEVAEQIIKENSPEAEESMKQEDLEELREKHNKVLDELEDKLQSLLNSLKEIRGINNAVNEESQVTPMLSNDEEIKHIHMPIQSRKSTPDLEHMKEILQQLDDLHKDRKSPIESEKNYNESRNEIVYSCDVIGIESVMNEEEVNKDKQSEDDYLKLENENNDLMKENKQLKEKNKDLEDKLYEMEFEQSNSSFHKDDLEKNYDEIKNENDNLNESLKAKESEYMKENLELESKLKEVENKLCDNESELKEKEDKIEELENENAKLKEKNELGEEIQRLLNDILEKDKNDEEMNELKENREKCLEELYNKYPSADVDRLENLCENLREIEERKSPYNELLGNNTQKNRIKKELSILERCLGDNNEDINDIIKELEDKIESAVEQMKEDDDELIELKKRRDELVRICNGYNEIYKPDVISYNSTTKDNEIEKEESVDEIKDEISKLEEILNNPELESKLISKDEIQTTENENIEEESNGEGEEELADLKEKRDELKKEYKDKFGNDFVYSAEIISDESENKEEEKVEDVKDVKEKNADKENKESEKKKLMKEIEILEDCLRKDNLDENLKELEDEMKEEKEKLKEMKEEDEKLKEENEIELNELKEKRNELLNELKMKNGSEDIKKLEELLNELDKVRNEEDDMKSKEDENMKMSKCKEEEKSKLKEEMDKLEELLNNPLLESELLKKAQVDIDESGIEDDELKELENKRNEILNEIKEKSGEEDIEKLESLLKELEDKKNENADVKERLLKEKEEKVEENEKLKNGLKSEICKLVEILNNPLLEKCVEMETKIKKLREDDYGDYKNESVMNDLQKKKGELLKEVKSKCGSDDIDRIEKLLEEIETLQSSVCVDTNESRDDIKQEIKRINRVLRNRQLKPINEMEKTIQELKDPKLKKLIEERDNLKKEIKKKTGSDDIKRLESLLQELSIVMSKTQQQPKEDKEVLKNEIYQMKKILNNPDLDDINSLKKAIKQSKDIEYNALLKQKESMMNDLTSKYDNPTIANDIHQSIQMNPQIGDIMNLQSQYINNVSDIGVGNNSLPLLNLSSYPDQNPLYLSFINALNNFIAMFENNPEMMDHALNSLNKFLNSMIENIHHLQYFNESSMLYTYLNSAENLSDDENEDENDNPEQKNSLIGNINEMKNLLENKIENPDEYFDSLIQPQLEEDMKLLNEMDEVENSLLSILPPEDDLHTSQLQYVVESLENLLRLKYPNCGDKIHTYLQQLLLSNNPESIDEIKNHLQQLNDLKNKVFDEKAKCEELCGNYLTDAMKNDNLKLENEKKDLKNEISSLSSSNEETDPKKIKDNLLSEVTEKYPEVSEILDELKEANDKHEKLVGELENLKKEKGMLEKKKSLTTKPPYDEGEVNKSLNEEIQILKDILSGKDPKKIIENLKKDIEEKQEKDEEIQNEIEGLTNAMKELAEEIEDYTNPLTREAFDNESDKELLDKRNALIEELQSKDGIDNNDLDQINELINTKNRLNDALERHLGEKEEKEDILDRQNKFISLISETADISLYNDNTINSRLDELNQTSNGLVDSVTFTNLNETNIDDYERMHKEVIKLTIENRKLLYFIKNKLKQNDYENVVEANKTLLEQNTTLQQQLLNLSGSQDGSYDYDNLLQETLEEIYNTSQEQINRNSTFYEEKQKVIEDMSGSVNSKILMLEKALNDQTIRNKELEKENLKLRKKIDKYFDNSKYLYDVVKKSVKKEEMK